MMGSISINLLPREVLLERSQNSKLVLVNKVSIAIVVAVLFFASATLAMRLAQSSELQKAQEGLAEASERASGLQSREEQVITLKQRLQKIKTLLGSDVKRREIFNLVLFLAPQDILVTEVQVDKDGNMTIFMNASSISSVETLISSLGDPEKNQNLIGTVNLEGLSLGRDSIYRLGFRITPKTEPKAKVATSGG